MVSSDLGSRRQIADEDVTARSAGQLVRDSRTRTGPVDRVVARNGKRSQLPHARGGCDGARRSACRRHAGDLARDDKPPSLTRSRVVDLDLRARAREGEVDVRRAARVVEPDATAGDRHADRAALVRECARDGEGIGHRIRADGQIGLDGSDGHPVRQVADEDASVCRLRQLVGETGARAGPVERRRRRPRERAQDGRRHRHGACAHGSGFGRRAAAPSHVDPDAECDQEGDGDDRSDAKLRAAGDPFRFRRVRGGLGGHPAHHLI